MGDAGVGKSRLLYEFRQQLDTEKSFLVEGRCDTYGISTPYLPFIDALRRGLDLNVGDSPEQLHDKAVTNTMVIDPALEVNLPLYLHLLSIESETHPLPKRLQGPELAAEMR
jgi:predicted ATPase